MKIKNGGVFVFYLIFVITIPYILGTLGSSLGLLKYYLPLVIALANTLTLSGISQFENLYQLRPTNLVAFLSTHFINLFALFGVMWQSISHTVAMGGSIANGIAYGMILFIIAFPFARQGLKFILEQSDLYLRKKTNFEYENNWHLLTTGLLYIIFLVGLQAIVLNMVDSTQTVAEINRTNNINRRIANKLSLFGK